MDEALFRHLLFLTRERERREQEESKKDIPSRPTPIHYTVILPWIQYGFVTMIEDIHELFLLWDRFLASGGSGAFFVFVSLCVFLFKRERILNTKDPSALLAAFQRHLPIKIMPLVQTMLLTFMHK